MGQKAVGLVGCDRDVHVLVGNLESSAVCGYRLDDVRLGALADCVQLGLVRAGHEARRRGGRGVLGGICLGNLVAFAVILGIFSHTGEEFLAAKLGP